MKRFWILLITMVFFATSLSFAQPQGNNAPPTKAVTKVKEKKDEKKADKKTKDTVPKKGTKKPA